MITTARTVAVAAAFLAGPAMSQDLGASVYETNCAQCHQPNGEGISPAFPALAWNENLSDAAHIIRRIRYGLKSMPAFPDLSPEEVAAVASFIRSSWGNQFAPVTESEAETLIATVEPPVNVAERSIWDGVYTEEQAQGARLIYLGACASCHGSRLNGAPDAADMSPAPLLAGTAFMRGWTGSTVGSLFEFTRNSMPIINPGQFSDQQYVDIVAYMLSYHGAPAGESALLPDIETLNDIRIEPAETTQ